MTYFYDGLLSEAQKYQVENNNVISLVKELHFKYGFKVIGINKDSANYTECEAQMARDDGLPICSVWFDGENYCYHSPFYRKERGSSTRDRYTLRSKKLSSLMGVLKKREVIPSVEDVMMANIGYNMESVERMIKNSISGATGKSLHELNPQDVHELLKRFFGDENAQINLEKCKTVLDKYNEADKLNAERMKEIGDFLLNEFYVVGTNFSDHLVIGSVKGSGSLGDMKPHVVKAFKRITTLDECEYPEVKAAMLMSKVVYEDKQERMVGKYIPYIDKYDKDLGMAFVNRRVGTYDLAWSFIPCATTSMTTPQSSANTTLTYTE